MNGFTILILFVLCIIAIPIGCAECWRRWWIKRTRQRQRGHRPRRPAQSTTLHNPTTAIDGRVEGATVSPQEVAAAEALRAKVVRAVFSEQTICSSDDLEANATADEEDNEDNSNTCSICIEPFRQGDTISTSLCGHAFHRDCILGWSQARADCPVCRQAMWDETTFNIVEQEIKMIRKEG